MATLNELVGNPPGPSWPLLSDDLQRFLGLPAIDADRAALLLSLAEDLCGTIVSPIDARASAVILAVAARAYVNAPQLQQGDLGTAHLLYGTTSGGGPIGGLYLSRQDKMNLRRLNGGSSAFATSILPVGVNAMQTLTVMATAGTFKLSIASFTTAPIVFNPTAAQLAAALAALPPLAGNIAVTGTFQIEFINGLATTDIPTFTVDATLLTGTAVVQTTRQGVPAPGQNIPPWGKDYYNGPRVLGNETWGGIW